MDGSNRETTPLGCGPILSGAQEAARPLKLQIFEQVRSAGSLSRVQVAKELNISPGTVSTLTAELIEMGLLQEASVPREAGESGRGRPPVALSIPRESRLVAGLKVADHEVSGIVVDLAGRQIASVAGPRPGEPLTTVALVAEIGRLLDRLLSSAGLTRRDIAGVGLGLPGFVDHATGRVHWSPVLSERNVAMGELLGEALGLSVALDNDANLVALAELWFGAGRDKTDFAVVTIEQGLGAGVVLNHGLFRGANGVGMELAHTKVNLDGALCRCGQRGCLEAYVADYALAREAAAALGAVDGRLPPTPVLLAQLFESAQNGNEAAASIFRRAGRYLAMGLANVVNLFDPSRVILSAVRMRYDYFDMDQSRRAMEDFILATGRPMPPLEVHEWGDLLWAHGAAALALKMVTDRELAG